MEGPAAIDGPEGPKGPRTITFTTDWFSHHIPNWKSWLEPLMSGQEVHCVEVGSWEGRSALWIAENVVNLHPRSNLWCVDVWSARDEKTGEVVYDRFRNNLLPHIETGKVIPLRGSSTTSS
jgi:hypothetical protein